MSPERPCVTRKQKYFRPSSIRNNQRLIKRDGGIVFWRDVKFIRDLLILEATRRLQYDPRAI
jgi:hypothetical protein